MMDNKLYLIGLNDLPENLSDEELRNISWGMGISLSNMGRVERVHFINYLLEKNSKASLATQCFVIDSLVGFIEELSIESQCRLLEAYKVLPQCKSCGQCCKRKINICGIYARLWRQVSVEGQKIIEEYIKSYKPSGKEEVSYREALAMIESDVKNHVAKESSLPLNKRTTDRPNIALIVPEYLSASSFLQPPIDMLMSAAQLRKAGYGVNFLDNRIQHFSIDQLIRQVGNSDIIIITTTPYDHIQNYFLDYRLRNTFKIINALKNAYPEKKHIVCGAHGTVRPDILFRDTLADIIIQWDYDYHILRLVNAIYSNKDIGHIPNVILRGDTYDNGITPVKNYSQADLDGGVFPAYDLIDFNNYYGDIYYNNRLIRQWRSGIILASRGCRHNCMFCFNFWGRNISYRDPMNVIEEMEYLQKHQNVNDIFFIDFHFTQDIEWVYKFCEIKIKKGITTKWSAQVRCDSVPYDLLKQMAAANCRSLWFGVESFDSCIIKSVHKYSGSDVAITALKDCEKVGIMPHQFIMLGLPGETRETLNKTIEHVHELKMPYTESILLATPRFGTEYYNLAKEQFPELGEDFYTLSSLRGIVANELRPIDLQEAISIFRNRNFIYQDKAPRLYQNNCII